MLLFHKKRKTINLVLDVKNALVFTIRKNCHEIIKMQKMEKIICIYSLETKQRQA